MRRPGYSSIVVSFASILVALASCAEPTALVPGASPAGPARSSSEGNPPSLLVCPANTSVSADATIGPLGGLVEAGGTTLVVPPGAVLMEHRFTVTVPASRLMEVQIRAEGYEHFEFLLPVQVTIDYSRCRGNPAVLAALSAYHIDEQTKWLLQLMPGEDDKSSSRYTFVTDHLSGYAIAN